MESLKSLLLPEEKAVSAIQIRTRSCWVYHKWRVLVFLVLFIALVFGYGLVISLTYKTTTVGPAYNATVTTYYRMNQYAEGMVEQGQAPSVSLIRLYFLTSYNYSSDCTDLVTFESAYVIAFYSNNGNQTGCSINVTTSYTVTSGAQGDFYLFNLNGFNFASDVYNNQPGDLVLVTRGTINSEGKSGIYTTTPEFQFKTGYSNNNVVISTNSNNWTYLSFDFQSIFVFALSARGWVWMIVGIVVTKIIAKLRGEKVHTTLVTEGDNIYFEV